MPRAPASSRSAKSEPEPRMEAEGAAFGVQRGAPRLKSAKQRPLPLRAAAPLASQPRHSCLRSAAVRPVLRSSGQGGVFRRVAPSAALSRFAWATTRATKPLKCRGACAFAGEARSSARIMPRGALRRRTVRKLTRLRLACPPRSGAGGGGGPEVDDGKADGSFHSPAFLAAHIASLQARAALGEKAPRDSGRRADAARRRGGRRRSA